MADIRLIHAVIPLMEVSKVMHIAGLEPLQWRRDSISLSNSAQARKSGIFANPCDENHQINSARALR